MIEAPGGPRAYLASLAMHGIKLGLDNIRFLLEAAGNPERACPAVHVAGTNGKGSVLAMLQAMLVAAGYRTGRFTSPHLMDLPERFQIDGRNIPEPALHEQIAFFRGIAARLPHPPTFFEFNTAVAFRYFAQERVDAALIETGMGGRLDATNVVAPVAAAITNIDYDHMQHLGDTLEKIAFEKAGILKPGVPAVCGETRPGPLGVIEARAREAGAPLAVLGRDFRAAAGGSPWAQTIDYDGLGTRFERAPLRLAGRHQAHNAAVAVTLALLVRPTFPKLDETAIRTGLAQAAWPGRMERVLENPPVIIDVAHNPAGMRQAAANFQRCAAIFAASSDKEAGEMIQLLAPIADPLILTVFEGKRSATLDALRAAAGGRPHRAAPSLRDAIAEGIAIASPDRPLLITGSIYAAGEARRILMDQYGAPAPRY